ncbi:MAG TPA: DUF2169 domain-containing protein [Polyangiaceae bacterium]|jgi:uncharacterized protein YjbI with pentapeptide repeats
MKIVKAMVVSFTFRPFLMLGEQRLCVTGMVGFSLAEGPRRLIADTHLWGAIGESTESIVDEGLPKPCGEVLVHAKCHAPGGRPVPVSQVRLRVAPAEPDARRTVDKKLAVFGDRVWRPGLLSRSVTDPVPFTEMPVTWARAFGGAKYPKNPIGRGIDPAEGTDQIPLPNVEAMTSLISSASQRPEPAGFGPLEMGWSQRQSIAGTYDARWLEEDFPGYARDTDPAFFNTAPADQRIAGLFRGDEEYALENMHPSRPTIRGKLPGVAVRVLLRRKGSLDVEDVSLKLDTLVFLPGKEIGVVVFRGTTIVIDDEAADIEYALAACEELGEPRSVEHYARALDRRLDKDQSPKLALFEDDLVPPFAIGANLAALRVPQNIVGATTAERERVLMETRKQVAKAAVAAPEVEKALDATPGPLPIPEPSPPPKPPKVGVGPPKPKAAQLEETLRVASIEPDADILKKLETFRRTDAEALQSYRASAHLRHPARELDPAERARAREVMRELRSSGASFAGLDWTRYDLSAYNLQNGNFRGTLLEGADLTGTNVTGADMSGAVLAHATLRDTRFDGATLEGTNLGETLIEGASFATASMRKAIFARAKLRSVSLREADLTGVVWLEAELGAVDFEGATIGEVTFLPGQDFTRCRFARAKAARSTFLSTKLDGVDFTQADVPTLTFITVSANGADFRKASMKSFCAVAGCSFEGASFEGADLTGAVILGANLRGANLEGTCLEGANLGGCDLTGAKLTGAQAKELNMARSNLTDATLAGANLMEAMLQKTTLHGTDLSKANLFLANLSRARLSTSTNVSGANLKRALMLPRARKEA